MGDLGIYEPLHAKVVFSNGYVRRGRVEIISDMSDFAGFDATYPEIYRACYVADPSLSAFGLEKMVSGVTRNTRLAQGGLLLRGYLDVVTRRNPDTQGAFRPIDGLFGKWPFIKRTIDDSRARMMTKEGEQ